MQLNVTHKKDNPFLKRTEVTATAIFEKQTPSNTEVASAIAKAVGADVKNIIVKHIKTKFGSTTATINALAYKDVDAMKNAEPVTHHIKKKIEEAAKKAKEGGQ